MLQTIAGGYLSSIIINQDRTVTAFGNLISGVSIYKPSNITDAIAVSAGRDFGFCLKADKTVIPIYDITGESPEVVKDSNVQALSSIIAVAAGGEHALFLTSDGRVITRGANEQGQCDLQGFNNVIAIAAGNEHSLLLQADGVVVAKGYNIDGRCTIPAGLKGVAIAAGGAHSLVLTPDGSVVAFGRNREGQCNIPIGLTGIVGIAAGGSHSLLLKDDGRVIAIGREASYSDYRENTNIQDVSDIIAIAAGGQHSILVKTDGTLLGFGDNERGQLDFLGQKAFAQQVLVPINTNLPPQVSVTKIVGNNIEGIVDEIHIQGVTTVYGPNIKIHALATDEITKVSKVQIFVQNQKIQEKDIQPPLSSCNFSFDVGLFPDITSAITIKAIDDNGNIGSSTLNVIYATKTTGPLIAVTSPSNKLAWQNAPRISGTWFDEDKIDTITVSAYQVDGGGSRFISATTISEAVYDPNNKISYTTPTSGKWSYLPQNLLDGKIELKISGQDKLGNISETTTFEFILDSTVPQIFIESPIDEITNIPQIILKSYAIERLSGLFKCSCYLEDKLVAEPIILSSKVGEVTDNRANPISYEINLVKVGNNNLRIVYSNQASINELNPIFAEKKIIINYLPSDYNLPSISSSLINGAKFVIPKIDFNVVVSGNDNANERLHSVTIDLFPRQNANERLEVAVPPESPTNFRGQLLSTQSILLSWDPVIDATSYVVIKNGFQILTTTQNSVVIDNLVFGETYTFSIKSINANETSMASKESEMLHVTMQGLAVNNMTTGSASLMWTSVANAVGYKVLQDGNLIAALPPTTTTVNIAGLTAGKASLIQVMGVLGTADVVSLNNLLLTPLGLRATFVPEDSSVDLNWDEQLGAATYNVFLDGQLIGTVTGTYYKVSNVRVGTTYEFLVQPLDGNNIVGISEPCTAIFAGLFASAINANSISLSWTINKDATVYDIYQDNVLVGTVISNHFTASNLTPETQYTFQLQAKNRQKNLGELQSLKVTTSTLLRQVPIPSTIGAGERYSIIINPDHTVSGFGLNSVNQLNAPPTINDALGLAVGERHTLVLRTNGQVVAFGDTEYGKCNIPTGIDNAVAVAAGRSHSLILREDGSVVGFGDNSSGQLEIPSDIRAISIAAGSNDSYIVKTDGTLAHYGSSYHPLLNIKTRINNAVKISASINHVLILNSDGTVIAFGHNEFGQCQIPAEIIINDAIDIAAGTNHSLVLRANGVVIGFGSNTAQNPYKLTAGNTNQATVPCYINDAVAISAGTAHSLILKADGTVLAWGGNFDGECSIAKQALLPPIVAPKNVHAILITSNKVQLCWQGVTGATVYDVFKNNEFVDTVTDTCFIVEGLEARKTYSFNVRAVSIKQSYDKEFSAKSEDIRIIIDIPTKPTGLVSVSQTINSCSLKWDKISNATFYKVIQNNQEIGTTTEPEFVASGLVLGDSLSFVVQAANDIGVSELSIPLTVVMTCPVFGSLCQSRTIAAGIYHSLVIKANGDVLAAGDNEPWFYGNADDGWYGGCNIPREITNVVEVAGGADFSLLLRDNGTVVACGKNNYGQCNIPTWMNNIVKVAAGVEHSLVLRFDGTVAAFGRNDQGQCNVPIGITNAIDISAGVLHSLVLRADGTVVAFGGNTDGQCNVPSGINNAIGIAAGAWHSLILKADGSVIAFGKNDKGQCNVPTNLRAEKIAAGVAHSLAIKTDKGVVAFGDNRQGQCNIPLGISNAIGIAGGLNFSLIIQENGTVITVTDYANENGLAKLAKSFYGGVTAFTPLACPSNMQRQLFENGITLSWDSVPLASSYIVFQNGIEIGSTINTYFDVALPDSNSCAFTVRAKNIIGYSGHSSPVIKLNNSSRFAINFSSHETGLESLQILPFTVVDMDKIVLPEITSASSFYRLKQEVFAQAKWETSLSLVPGFEVIQKTTPYLTERISSQHFKDGAYTIRITAVNALGGIKTTDLTYLIDTAKIVASVSIANGAKDIALNQPLEIVFSEPMDRESVLDALIISGIVAYKPAIGSPTWSDNDTRLTYLNPHFVAGDIITIIFRDNIAKNQDKSKTLREISTSFTAASFSGPMIEHIDIKNNQEQIVSASENSSNPTFNIKRNTQFVVYFSKIIKIATLKANSSLLLIDSLLRTCPLKPLGDNFTEIGMKTTATFELDAELAYRTQFCIEATSAIKDGKDIGLLPFKGYFKTQTFGGTDAENDVTENVVVQMPEFEPNATTFQDVLSVKLHPTTTDSTVYYTLDGTRPSIQSYVYVQPITLNATTTIKAFAIKAGMADSNINTAIFSKQNVVEQPLRNKVAKPTVSPDGGVFKIQATNITLATTTLGADIYYGFSSALLPSIRYTGPIPFIAETTELVAIAKKTGLQDSDIVVKRFEIEKNPQKLSSPIFSPNGGSHVGMLYVAIETNTNPAANIFYTLDGTTPTINSYKVDGAIAISKSCTLKAFATRDGSYDSDVATTTFTITSPVSQVLPVFYSIKLTNGLNGLSIPVDNRQSKYNNLTLREFIEKSTNAKVGAIAWYDAVAQKWKTSMGTEKDIIPFDWQNGFFIQMVLNTETILRFSGYVIDEGKTTLKLKKGFNLVGFPVDTSHRTMKQVAEYILRRSGGETLVTYMCRKKNSVADTTKRLIGYTYTGTSSKNGMNFTIARLGGDAIGIVSPIDIEVPLYGSVWKD